MDEREVGLTIGMKFGPNAPGLDSAARKLQSTDDPATLPKFPPSLDDESDKGSKKAKTSKANDEDEARKSARSMASLAPGTASLASSNVLLAGIAAALYVLH
ncbi:hypothetical protein FBU59_006682 [Linderina macrospora]|uniref:Uncharacterized protein n=1 Tax=Linderina macrospora TaxID=4868 RepID=A0ACC1IZD1_9FUNG|nr:hypothetical protein FBU59_006682 [Linderina macrospora]